MKYCGYIVATNNIDTVNFIFFKILVFRRSDNFKNFKIYKCEELFLQLAKISNIQRDSSRYVYNGNCINYIRGWFLNTKGGGRQTSKLGKDFTQVIIRFKVSNIPYEIFNIGLNGDSTFKKCNSRQSGRPRCKIYLSFVFN